MSDLPEPAENNQSAIESRPEEGSAGEDELKKSVSPEKQKLGVAGPIVPTPGFSFASDAWKLNLFETESSPTGDGRQETLNKIADDLLELEKRTTAIEGHLNSIASNIDRFQRSLESAARGQTIEIERLKEKLISDRKELISRGTFNAIRPAIESLNFMIEIYRNRPEDGAMLRQTRSILDLLTSITQLLGYRPFEVAPGDDFNPHTMECSGYGQGVVGKVVRVDQPGYVAGDVMVRPCKVILGHTVNGSEPTS
jgi:molecular chaperone GrpE (heat shock protein)